MGGGRFFCEVCCKPSPEEVAAAKAAGLAPEQPGNMPAQEARGDAGMGAVYMVDGAAREVFYADVANEMGGLQSQPFYKGSEGRSPKTRPDGRVQGPRMRISQRNREGHGLCASYCFAPPRREPYHTPHRMCACPDTASHSPKPHPQGAC